MPNKHHETNREAWNEMVEVHWKHPDYKVKEFLEGRNSVKSIERQAFGDVTGKSLLHLMCQFGMDTLSWARLGAKVAGVDISDRSIARARELAEQAGIEATFVRSDVTEAIGKIDQKFDLVFQSYGTLAWLADLKGWAATISHYLKPGGSFLIVDSHPVQYIYDEEDPTIYLERKTYHYVNNPDYCDKDHIIKHKTVEHVFPLMDIFSSLIDVGLSIRRFEEFDVDFDMANSDWKKVGDYYEPPNSPSPYPLMFSLLATK